MKKAKKNNKGFSLVELIVVIAIMAVLMGVLAPQFLRYVEKSRAQKDASAVGEVYNATKIALMDEKIAKDVNAKIAEPADAKVTIANTGAVSTTVTSLTTEITTVTASNLSFVSNAFTTNGDITFTITGNATNGYTITVAGMPTDFTNSLK